MLLYSFDPHKYTKNSLDLCDILDGEDSLGMDTLVNRFIQQIRHDDDFYDHIVALQAPSGGGKSFFLALLYCKLLKDENEYPIKYMDILDYVADDNAQQCIDDIERLCDKGTKTSVVLLDNLDKHTPKFIYEFIHMLHRLTSQDNFLFVVAYDYTLLYSKLSKYLGDDQEIEGYLQGHIHLDFLLDINDLEINNILYDMNFHLIQELIYSAYETNMLSLKQVVITLAKLKIYLSDNSNASPEEILIALKLIIVKLACKMLYIAIFKGEGENYDCNNIKLQNMLHLIEEKIKPYRSSQFSEEEVNIMDIDVIKKMEISNV